MTNPGPSSNAAPPRAQETAAGDVVSAPDPAAHANEQGAPEDTPRPIDGVVDPFLTAQLRIFVQEKGRLPETFAEFAGARLDSVPRLPKGLHFAIDPTTQEVKIAKQ
jgi:hypothetical protein